MYMNMSGKFVCKCGCCMHIGAHQKAGSKQFAQQPSTPATLHTVTVGVCFFVCEHMCTYSSSQPGFAAGSVKEVISSDKASKKKKKSHICHQQVKIELCLSLVILRHFTLSLWK